MRKTYRAYNLRGELLLSCWTESDGAEYAERQAFQSRLDRRERDGVDMVYIVSEDPTAPIVEMRPNREPRNLR